MSEENGFVTQHPPKLIFPAEESGSGMSFLKQFSVNETFALHSHTFYELFYICSGKCVHLINGLSQILEKGSLVFIRPEDTHKFEFINDFDITIISCGIECPVAQNALSYCGADYMTKQTLPPHVILKGEDFLETLRTLEKIPLQKIGEERKKYVTAVLPSLIYLFTKDSDAPDSSTRQGTHGSQKESPKVPVWFTDLLSELDKNLNFTKGLPWLIKKSGVTQEHLTRVFRLHLSMTPTEYLNYKKVLYAAELLKTSRYTILQVAYQSGFSTPAYFYRSFRRYLNCTPGENLLVNPTAR